MFMGSKETQCTNCGHREVCSYKNDYLTVQKAVDDICIDVGKDGIICVANMEWLRLTLCCKRYISDITTRR